MGALNQLYILEYGEGRAVPLSVIRGFERRWIVGLFGFFPILRGRSSTWAAPSFVSPSRLPNRYHAPGDELRDDMLFGGLLQQTRVALRLGYMLANSTLRTQWNESEAFAETRARSEAEAGF